jgi:hypothetical protein
VPKLTITGDLKQTIDAAIERFNQTVIQDPNLAYAARYRGRFLYLDRLDFGEPTPIARLTYTGDLSAWEFAIYKYSTEKYDPDEWLFPGAQHLDGTLEGAMRAGLEAYP